MADVARLAVRMTIMLESAAGCVVRIANRAFGRSSAQRGPWKAALGRAGLAVAA